MTVSDVVDTHDRLYTITTGSFSSRFASQGTTAVVRATRQVKEKILRIGAHLMEANVEDMDMEGREDLCKGTRRKSPSACGMSPGWPTGTSRLCPREWMPGCLERPCIPCPPRSRRMNRTG